MGERVVPKAEKQAELWEEASMDADLEAAIAEVADCEANRMSWARKELDARGKLTRMMQEKGYTVEAGYKHGGFLAWLDVGEPKAKVRAPAADADA